MTFREFVNAIGVVRLARATHMYDMANWLWERTVIAADRARGRAKWRRFYRQFVRPGDLVFDVGANVGERAAVFASLGARVVAIEPQASCLAVLRRRFGGDPRVAIVDQALGERAGVGELAVCAEAPTISTLSRAWQEDSVFAGQYTWDSAERVQITTMDALMAEHGVPRFCKIDVEGYEGAVLAGMGALPGVTSFEFHEELLDDAKRCMDRLAALGPVEFNCSLDESLTFLRPDWTDADALHAALERIRARGLWGDIYARAR